MQQPREGFGVLRRGGGVHLEPSSPFRRIPYDPYDDALIRSFDHGSRPARGWHNRNLQWGH